jgi:hypothetical protein
MLQPRSILSMTRARDEAICDRFAALSFRRRHLWPLAARRQSARPCCETVEITLGDRKGDQAANSQLDRAPTLRNGSGHSAPVNGCVALFTRAAQRVTKHVKVKL